MYAITGITGQVGGALARELIAAHLPVRAVVRDLEKAREWIELGCEVAVATMTDGAALASAFHGTAGVFILPPPEFDPKPGFPEVRAVIAAVVHAVETAKPGKVVCLSTIGAQATRSNLLTQHTLMESALSKATVPVAFLRPAWFMENFAWDLQSAREHGVIPSFLQPLDRPIPMIATADVGRVAADLLRQTWEGIRVVELEGRRMSPHDAADAFANILGTPVRAQAVPRESWLGIFTQQGMKHPEPRIHMLDGFNEGWISFEGGDNDVLRGGVSLEDVLRGMVTTAQG